MTPFEFSNPHGLWFLLFLFAFLYLWKTSLSPLPPWREKLSLLSRLLMVLCLVGALAEMRLVWTVKKLSVLFILDISESVNTSSQAQGIEWINQASKAMTENDQAALIVFGANAYVDMNWQPRFKITEITSIPERNFTDISRAIRLALASFPDDTQKKIVLITDGNENLGNALNEAIISKSNNIPIYCKKINQVPEVEVLIENVIIPSEVRLNQTFEMKLLIKSFQKTTTKVRLYRDGEYLEEGVFELDEGMNIFKIPQKMDTPGFVNYEITLEPREDTLPVNNTMMGFTLVQGESKVLYIEGKKGKSDYLANALREAGLIVDVKSQYEIPTTLPELNNYDCVILSDISSHWFSYDQMLFFNKYVSEMGGGLIMVGGEDSFGVGLYAKTPIEEALPVDMDIRQKKHLASMAMEIVIDQSGSMGAVVASGQTKMQLANEAACATIDFLKLYDMVEVLMTDTAPKSLFPLQKIGTEENRYYLQDCVRSNRGGGGGIYCYAGLLPAYRNLRQVDSIVKHIILFADGSDAEQQEGCEQLAVEGYADGITLTTISLGNGHHTPFLRNLAMAGAGQFYLTDNAMDLPRIFAKDTMIASKNVLVEKTFFPTLVGNVEFLKGINWQETPSLYGYVATTKKESPLVEEIMQGLDGDPLLVRWQYGLGKSVAFTSDVKDRWSKDWLHWEGYKKLWPQLVRWSLRSKHKKNIRVHQKFERGKGFLVVEALDDEGNYENFLNLEARIVKPDGTSHGLPLNQTAPGQYSGDFPALSEGIYMFNLVEHRDSQPYVLTSVAASQSYPIEYKDLEPKDALLNQISEITDGKVINDFAGLFKLDQKEVKAYRDIFLPLLLSALLLLLLDIMARRLVLPHEMFKIRTRVKVAESQASAMMGRLRARKESIRDRTSPQASSLLQDLQKKSSLPSGNTVVASAPPPPPPRPDPLQQKPEEDTYTSRLLKAKKRAQEPKS
jgi:Ca-activated chloride channel family protein